MYTLVFFPVVLMLLNSILQPVYSCYYDYWLQFIPACLRVFQAQIVIVIAILIFLLDVAFNVPFFQSLFGQSHLKLPLADLATYFS